MTSTWSHRLASLVATVFLPLAAGALWAVLSLRFRAELPALALLCAAAVWPARAHFADLSRLPRALVYASACAAGIAYAQWLKSASVIASEIGIAFIDALCDVGLELSFALARERISATGLAMIGLSVLVAAAIGTSGARRTAVVPGSAASLRPKSAP